MEDRRLTRRQLIGRATALGALLALSGVVATRKYGAQTPTAPRRPPDRGSLPRNGTPIVAGAQLPPGRRFAPFALVGAKAAAPVGWVTDAGVDDAFELADRLSRSFSETGLWPILWLGPEEDLSGVCTQPRAVERVDARKAEAVLGGQWRAQAPPRAAVAPLEPSFPGLARSTGRTLLTESPFALLAKRVRQDESSPHLSPPHLALVPCRRPADVIAAIGFQCGVYSGVQDPAMVSSVLRSWEDRFSATLVGLAEGSVLLAVGSPPRDFHHALRIAAEHYALAPTEGAHGPGSLAEVANGLLGGRPPYLADSREVWSLYWDW